MATAVTTNASLRRLSQGELDLVITAHERFVQGKPGGKTGASLRCVDLSGLNMANRELSDADLSGSSFDKCRMSRVRLESANLFGCDFRKADLREAVLRRADLRGASLRGANVAQADLTQADFREGQIGVANRTNGLDMLHHDVRRGQLDQANFAGAKLEGAQLDHVSACAADFTDCSMAGAILTGANLKEANLSGANLEGAEIGGAILENAKLTGAVLTGVDVRKARSATGADLTGCLNSPSEKAVARARDLMEKLVANQMWCVTGGKQGAPAIMNGEDFRPLGLQLRGFRLTALSAKNACLMGLDLSGCQFQGGQL